MSRALLLQCPELEVDLSRGSLRGRLEEAASLLDVQATLLLINKKSSSIISNCCIYVYSAYYLHRVHCAKLNRLSLLELFPPPPAGLPEARDRGLPGFVPPAAPADKGGVIVGHGGAESVRDFVQGIARAYQINMARI